MYFKIVFILLSLTTANAVDRSAPTQCRMLFGGYDYNDILAKLRVTYRGIHISLHDSVTIKSPYTDSIIGNSRTCMWSFNLGVQNLKIEFKQFDLVNSPHCSKEFISWNFSDYPDKNRRFCGNSYPEVLDFYPQFGTMSIIYYSENSPSINGFNIKISNDPFPHNVTYNVNATDNLMYIYSPGYPDLYYDDLNFIWKMKSKPNTVILLEFLYFFLEKDRECQFDFLKVIDLTTKNDHLICNRRKRFILNTNSSDVKIHFDTDDHVERDGFEIRYYSLPRTSVICGRQEAVSVYPYRTSLLSMEKTNGRKCRWNLIAAQDSVIVLELISFYTPSGACDVKLTVTDTFDQTSGLKTHKIFNCINKVFKNYRSWSSSLEIEITDTSPDHFQANNNFTISYYSVHKDVVTSNLMTIDRRPSFIWLPTSNNLLIKTDNSLDCVKLELLDANLNVIEDFKPHLKVYDGNNEKSPDMIDGCGRDFKIESEIIGTQQYLFVKSISSSGVWLILEASNKCSGTSKRMLILSDEIILSPNYPHMYPRNALCRYEIDTSPDYRLLCITAMTNNPAPGCTNFVKFTNGDYYNKETKKWCLNQEYQITMVTTKMDILFKSDGYSGSFRITIKSAVNSCGGYDNDLLATSAPKYITSPNYPHQYPKNLDYQLTIRSIDDKILLTIIDLALSSIAESRCADYLSIQATSIKDEYKYCSGTHIQNKVIESTGKIIYVKFKTDAKGFAKGWNISYVAIGKDPNYCNKVLTANKIDQSIMFEPRHAGSPTYYGEYTCFFLIKKSVLMKEYGLKVIFTDLNFRGFCSFNYVSVYDSFKEDSNYLLGKMCNSVRYKYFRTFPSSNSIYVKVNLKQVDYDGYDLHLGFNLTYGLQKPAQCNEGRPSEFTAQIHYIRLTSPNYGIGFYGNNQYCRWLLKSKDKKRAVRIKMNKFDIDPLNSYLVVYDGMDQYSKKLGRYDSTPFDMMESSGNVLYIEFFSGEDKPDYDGFDMSYAMGNNIPISDSSQTSSLVGSVVGSVVSVLVLIIVVIGCCIFCSFKKRRLQSQPTRRRRRSSGNVYNNTNNTVFVLSSVNSNATLPPPYPGLPSDSNYQLSDLPPAYTITPDEQPPAYEELPSYENSAQFEITNSPSTSSINTNLTQLSRPDTPENHPLRRYPRQENIMNTTPTRTGSIDNLPSYENSAQFEITNSSSTSSINTNLTQLSRPDTPENHPLRRYPRQENIMNTTPTRSGSNDNLVERSAHTLHGIDNPVGPRRDSPRRVTSTEV